MLRGVFGDLTIEHIIGYKISAVLYPKSGLDSLCIRVWDHSEPG